MKQSWRQQDWRHCNTSCPAEGVNHCLVMSLDSMQMFLHTSPNPIDADGPFDWSEVRRQMATDMVDHEGLGVCWQTCTDVGISPRNYTRTPISTVATAQWRSGPRGLWDDDNTHSNNAATSTHAFSYTLLLRSCFKLLLKRTGLSRTAISNSSSNNFQYDILSVYYLPRAVIGQL